MFYIEIDKPVNSKFLKLILKFNGLMSYVSIFAFLFIAMVMSTQYHNKMKSDAYGDISEIDMLVYLIGDDDDVLMSQQDIPESFEFPTAIDRAGRIGR